MVRSRFILIFLAFGLLGCRAVAEDVAPDLRLNLGIEPATIDPALATDPGSQQIARMLFPSLIDLDAATSAPQHGLAISWAVSSDELIWEFKLRDDAIWVRYAPARNLFETKRKITARDVVYSVRRVFDPRVGSGFAAQFAPIIRGAEQLRAADPIKTTDADFERLFNALGVTALDDFTVRFTLTRPTSFFPTILSTWLARLQPRESIETGESVWTEPGTIWSSGPYVLERWAHNREIILKKNPYWFDAASVSIERIRFAMIADTATALDEYKNDNLDSLDPYGALDPTEVDHLREDPILSKQLHIAPTLCAHYYGFNTTKEPFKDPFVRKAFIAATDRDTLVSSVIKLGEPARWFTRPGVYASFDISDTLGASLTFNVKNARDFVQQSSYANKRLPAITLGVNTSETHIVFAETLAQMWKTNLGVEVRVARLDWKSYLQNLRDNPPEIFRLGYCAFYPDAANFANVFRPNSPDNFTRWNSPQFDQIITTATREMDTAKRRTYYRAAEKILIEDNAVILPLWWSDRATLTKPNIKRSFAITDGYERFETWELR